MSPDKPQCLPDPFEWIYIPAGSLRLQYPPYNSMPFLVAEVPAFFISKYPVTNAQYEVYLQKSGRKRSNSPFRDDPQFNQPLQPVIDVRWHEALQFCEWLSDQSGSLTTLPSDAQWQRAAQGDDHRRYPWGNEWDSSRCNTGQSKIGHTTPVTQYPLGASPYGVMDMIGNVSEWCLTDAKTGENSSQFTFPISVEELLNEERIFKGGDYTSKASGITRGQDVIENGSIAIFWSYLCGIRLIMNINSFA